MTDLPTRLQTHIRHRAARGASEGELALLREVAAELPSPERAFDFPALLRELYPDPFTLAGRRFVQAFADMAEAISKCSIKETA
ncbi:hypothetical protein QR90_06680 [Deinococcus radiopugnans]|uniref:Uncharacterized protein n=1 Tax=Deinococcus radiopugnans TaxID=57497 RepID=A0A0A7KFI3_9DEIO|nr:hypothetical protein [Deinococcus radiopugnans]AIZ44855.1 hypothetical protein QR90_06680 [Deinococcus radiopugnans]